MINMVITVLPQFHDKHFRCNGQGKQCASHPQRFNSFATSKARTL